MKAQKELKNKRRERQINDNRTLIGMLPTKGQWRERTLELGS
jgi:hypothetical protein